MGERVRFSIYLSNLAYLSVVLWKPFNEMEQGLGMFCMNRLGVSSLSKPRLREKLSDFLFGMFLFDLYMRVRGFARKHYDAVNVLLFGEFIGIPLLNAYFTVRLLPYFVGELDIWSRRSLREKAVIGLV